MDTSYTLHRHSNKVNDRVLCCVCVSLSFSWRGKRLKLERKKVCTKRVHSFGSLPKKSTQEYADKVFKHFELCLRVR